MQIYNTLTRKKEEFKPAKKGRIGMYVCGPTVYDVPHIGHARSAFVFEVIRTYFEYLKYKVDFVRNITDIDDKIINKAKKEIKGAGTDDEGGLLNKKTQEIAVKYLEIYREKMQELGIREPSAEPKATDNIDAMIEFIKILIKKGHAYESEGDVYFSVDSFNGYGKLSNRNKEELMHGVRKEVKENKKHPLDFALWKKSGEDEPYWESPWGRGRPGWHIECSVMSTGILGNSFDIHGGGIDLIFPHHENEIAQAEAATGRPFARYWIHNGLLTVDGEKMSKSQGNYVTIDDFLDKHGDTDLLKLVFLNSHYRSPIDCGHDRLEEARRAKERILIFLDRTRRLGAERRDSRTTENVRREAEELTGTLAEAFKKNMEDDFNTPGALSVIFDAVKKGNDILAGDRAIQDKICLSGSISDFIEKHAAFLGLSLREEGIGDDLAGEAEKLVAMRKEARKRKDFKAADDIRDELLSKGIVVEDTPKGPVWRKK